MTRRIILITGGQRSGKSEEAERLALSLAANPVYLATAHVWDDEFRQRVRLHQERRGPQWTNIEEALNDWNTKANPIFKTNVERDGIVLC